MTLHVFAPGDLVAYNLSSPLEAGEPSDDVGIVVASYRDRAGGSFSKVLFPNARPPHVGSYYVENLVFLSKGEEPSA